MVVDAIRSGVQTFDLGKLACLRPDWSKQGLLSHAQTLQLQSPITRLLHHWLEGDTCRFKVFEYSRKELCCH